MRIAILLVVMNVVLAAGAQTCVEAEPNQTTASATPISLGVPCSGNVSSSDASSIVIVYDPETQDGIEDVFRLTLPSPARVSASLAFGSGDLDLFLFVVSGTTPGVVAASNTSASPESFVTATVLPAGTYYLGVSAFSGSSSYVLTVQAQSGVAGAPNAPSNLTATATSSNSIRLDWRDNSDNESGFIIEQRNSSGTFVFVRTVSANSTSATISGLVGGQTATFRVRATNGSGDSPFSNEATATTPSTPSLCIPTSTVVCLLNDRFRVSVAFRNQFANPPAPGDFLGTKLTPGSQNPDVGIFGISSPQAIEVVVRIQDARPFGQNRFDIYYGGLTDLEYTVTVTDTFNGRTATYHNPPGLVGGGVDRTGFPAN
ncbi:MAG TPA: fibronectin type III domain-containing protein [Thermoanaerobaculia bacterium]